MTKTKTNKPKMKSPKPVIIGLSGGVAAGKNFVAEVFAKEGAVVFDADKEVHRLLESDLAVIGEVQKKFPTSVGEGKINRKILGQIVFADEKKLKILEKILHPRVRKSYLEFLEKARKEERKIVVLNIPLLLESRAYKCDYVVAVVAPVVVRKKRFLERVGGVLRSSSDLLKKEKSRAGARRSGGLKERFERIRKRQMSDLERKKRADFVVRNGGVKSETVRQVEEVLRLVGG